MNQNGKEIWDFPKEEELKYAQMIDNGQYSEIPKNWLGFFLKERVNLKISEKILEDNGIQRPAITTMLRQRINEIEAELNRRA